MVQAMIRTWRRYILGGIISAVFLLGVGGFGIGEVQAQNKKCDPKTEVALNMRVPFVGKCIKKDIGETGETNYTTVFPKLMGGVSRIVMTAIVIVGFMAILLGGFMIAGSGAFGTKEQGKKLIISVIAGFILLGASGIILNMINPEFFGTDS